MFPVQPDTEVIRDSGPRWWILEDLSHKYGPGAYAYVFYQLCRAHTDDHVLCSIRPPSHPHLCWSLTDGEDQTPVRFCKYTSLQCPNISISHITGVSSRVHLDSQKYLEGELFLVQNAHYSCYAILKTKLSCLNSRSCRSLVPLKHVLMAPQAPFESLLLLLLVAARRVMTCRPHLRTANRVEESLVVQTALFLKRYHTPNRHLSQTIHQSKTRTLIPTREDHLWMGRSPSSRVQRHSTVLIPRRMPLLSLLLCRAITFHLHGFPEHAEGNRVRISGSFPPAIAKTS